MPDRGTAHKIGYADPFDGAFNIEVSVHKSHKASLRVSSMQQTREGIYKK
jgi:CTP-dependent riboflavin kinase